MVLNLKKGILLLLLIVSFTPFVELTAQSINGIYSDGEVSLHLEETEDGVLGLFADSDGSYYEAYFFSDEDGLIGMLGEFGAFIPWDTDIMTLIIMPLDANEEPILEQAIEFELDFVSELNTATEQVDYSQLKWTPIKKFGNDFYPSYVLATSTWSEEIKMEMTDVAYNYYGDRNGYFGVNVENFPIGSIVRIEIEGEPLAKRSSYTTTITMEGINEIFPVIEYDYEALKNIDQAKPVNFKYSIYLNNQLLGEKLEVVWVRSVNDAVTYAVDHYGRQHVLDIIFAAYVNENEPSLDNLLGEMLDYKIVNSWIGYQGTEADVINQVYTLWHHFQKKGFKYSSITTQSGTDERSQGQVVRFVGDALKSSQANCIDGTVLFASFLYKIGIDVSIVLVPGHAYLAFSLTPDGSKTLALETTLLGNLDIEHVSSQEDLYNSKNGLETSERRSWSSFLGAVHKATEDYKNNAKPNIDIGDPRYMEINIAKARQQRIRPIK